MSDNVVSLRGEEIVNDRRAAFVQTLAESFDLYVKALGKEPDAFVWVFTGIGQESRIGFDVQGASQEMDCTTEVLCKAAVLTQAEAQSTHVCLDD